MLIINKIFNSRGYESCGSFGTVLGIILGSILGIIIVSKAKITNYSKVIIWLLVLLFAVPLLYGILTFWPLYDNDDFFIIMPIALVLILFSAIPSLIILGIIRLYNFIRKKAEYN